MSSLENLSNIAPLDAILLAGGEGMRLRPLTQRLPKPLLPVGNAPLIAQILHGLAGAGVRQAALATGYKAEAMQRALGTECQGVQLRHVIECHPLGSGGALNHVLSQCPVAEDVWVAGADILHNIDIPAVQRFHRAAREHGALVTIVSREVEDVTGFGICECDDEGRVQRFLEKPPAGSTTSRLANTALWIFSRAALEMLPPGPSSVERELFPALAARGALWTWAHRGGFWLDCGTPERLVEANLGALAGSFPACLEGSRTDNSLSGAYCQLDDAAALTRCTLGRGVTVEKDARLEECVLLDGVFIGEGARLERCIIEQGTRVPPDTAARDRILT